MAGFSGRRPMISGGRCVREITCGAGVRQERSVLPQERFRAKVTTRPAWPARNGAATSVAAGTKAAVVEAIAARLSGPRKERDAIP